jgi:hypothetical protein
MLSTMKYALLQEPARSMAPLPYRAPGGALLLLRSQPPVADEEIDVLATILSVGGRVALLWQTMTVVMSEALVETPRFTVHDEYQWSRRIGSVVVRSSYSMERYCRTPRDARRSSLQVGRGASGLMSAARQAEAAAASLCRWQQQLPESDEAVELRAAEFFTFVSEQLARSAMHALSIVDSNAKLHWLVPFAPQDAQEIAAVAAGQLPEAAPSEVARLFVSTGAHYSVGVA